MREQVIDKKGRVFTFTDEVPVRTDLKGNEGDRTLYVVETERGDLLLDVVFAGRPLRHKKGDNKVLFEFTEEKDFIRKFEKLVLFRYRVGDTWYLRHGTTIDDVKRCIDGFMSPEECERYKEVK